MAISVVCVFIDICKVTCFSLLNVKIVVMSFVHSRRHWYFTWDNAYMNGVLDGPFGGPKASLQSMGAVWKYMVVRDGLKLFGVISFKHGKFLGTLENHNKDIVWKKCKGLFAAKNWVSRVDTSLEIDQEGFLYN